MWLGLAEVGQRLAQVDRQLVLAAMALYAASIWLVALRWREVLAAFGQAVSVLDAVRGHLVSIVATNVTPLGGVGGEVSRVAWIRARALVPLPAAAASAVVDRLVEVPAIVLLVAAAYPAGSLVVAELPAWPLGLASIGVMATLVWVARHRTIALAAVRLWIARSRSLGRPRRVSLVLAAGIAALVWAQDVARIALVAAACGVWLDPSQAALLAFMTIIGGLAPTPGGLGGIEGGLVAGLLALGVQPSEAVAITAVERGVSYLFGTSLGLVAVALTAGRTLWIRTRSLSSATGTLLE